jgi:HAD superfamily hydrolase (TIGR01490 family)
MGVAYFDVDGTLVGTNLLHPTWWFLSNQQSPLASAKRLGRALLRGPSMAVAETKDRRLFNEMLYAQYAGMSEDRLMALAEEVFEEVVIPRMYAGSVDLVRKCKDAGLDVVFVTGSLDITMAPLARHLGADRVIANSLELKHGVATGKLTRPIVAGPTKERLCSNDARKHGHDLAEAFAYTDSYSDVPMLSIVGHPYCVHPDRKLARLARAYSWPILDLRA